jgi:2'-5' RNA ligase
MHRLFVAIRPPEAIRDRLLDLMEGLEAARWQGDDQLHLTLRFIGEVDRHTAEDVASGLTAVRHPRFGIALHNLGTFERRGRAGALWAGVAPHDQLHALHRKIDQACVRAGLEPEHRAFAPHITLARLKRGTGVAAFVAERFALASEPFEVDNFILYQSDLTPAGAVYSAIARYPLV